MNGNQKEEVTKISVENQIQKNQEILEEKRAASRQRIMSTFWTIFLFASALASALLSYINITRVSKEDFSNYKIEQEQRFSADRISLLQDINSILEKNYEKLNGSISSFGRNFELLKDEISVLKSRLDVLNAKIQGNEIVSSKDFRDTISQLDAKLQDFKLQLVTFQNNLTFYLQRQSSSELEVSKMEEELRQINLEVKNIREKLIQLQK